MIASPTKIGQILRNRGENLDISQMSKPDIELADGSGPSYKVNPPLKSVFLGMFLV